MGGSSLAPEVTPPHVRGRPPHVLDTTHPARSAGSTEARPRAHALRRRLEVGNDARDPLPPRLLRERRPRRALRGDHGSRLRARAARAGARLPRVFNGEPTIGGRYSALSAVRDGAGRADGHRPRAAARARRRDGRGLPAARRNPGLELGLALGDGWQRRPRQDLINPNPGGFGLWAEQLLAESTGKEGKGLVPAPGESMDGPDRQAPRCGCRPVRARAGVLPLGVRDRGRRLDPRDQPVRPAERAGGEGPDERDPRGRQRPGRGARARSTSCSRRRGPATTSAIQAFVDPAREGGSTR